MLTDTSNPVSNYNGQLDNCMQGNDSLQLLKCFLSRFSINMDILSTRDPVTNHSSIYYVTQHGLLDMFQSLWNSYRTGNLTTDTFFFSKSALLEDDLGNSPLKLAVSCGFEEATGYLLDFLARNQCLESGSWELVSASLLAVAISINSGSSEQLLTTKPDINYQNVLGETALYTAARSDAVEIANKLLICKANVEMAERTRRWTPLIIASDEPILEDMTNNPWHFRTTTPSNANLLFNLHHETVTADEVRNDNHIGSAVALLDSLKQGLGPARESLIRDHTIPI